MRAAEARWLYHVRPVPTERLWPYAPPSLDVDGFIHASYRDAVLESAALYFPPEAKLEVLAIDPRKLARVVDIAATPRGPMPHILGPIEQVCASRIFPLPDFGKLTRPDRISPATDALEAMRDLRDRLPRDLDVLDLLRDALVACAAECEAWGEDAVAASYLREAEEFSDEQK